MKLLLHYSFQECKNVVIMIDKSGAPSYIFIYNKCHWHHYIYFDDHMAILELDNNKNMNVDDDKFKNQELINIKLYQFFKTLIEYTCNKHAVKFKNSDNFNNRDINHNYN